MGWKNLKEHYRIEHYVQVAKEGICIGSPYVHDLIVIGLGGGLDGKIVKRDDGCSNEDLRRYMTEMEADPEKVRQLIETADTFEKSIPVYTYEGGEIIEKQCEKPGWPNVTHDGDMMYENTFTSDKKRAVKWAKGNAKGSKEWCERRIEELRQALAENVRLRDESQSDLAKLEADYPSDPLVKG